jgi:hypothetical protein
MVTEIRIQARQRVGATDLLRVAMRAMAPEGGADHQLGGQPAVRVGLPGVRRRCGFVSRFGKSAVCKSSCPLPSRKVVLPGVGLSAVLWRTTTA